MKTKLLCLFFTISAMILSAQSEARDNSDWTFAQNISDTFTNFPDTNLFSAANNLNTRSEKISIPYNMATSDHFIGFHTIDNIKKFTFCDIFLQHFNSVAMKKIDNYECPINIIQITNCFINDSFDNDNLFYNLYVFNASSEHNILIKPKLDSTEVNT